MRWSTGLPPDVYRAMAAEFDRAYPAASRCDAKTVGCWQASERPKRVYAFSFDGIYDKPAYSRRVTGIDFSDAEWQRLGFVNEVAYNWYSETSDVKRGQRRRGVQALLHPWHITMPHFVMFSFPAAFVGSQLCWQGTVLWEGASGSFTALPQAEFACRTLAPGDVGKRIFGVAIAPDAPLAMTLRPTFAIRILQLYRPALAFLVVIALLFLLLRWNPRRLVFPLTLVGLSLVVIAASDATLLGGVRPFDAGNDGLVYDSWARMMVQQLLAGDIVGALMGGETVFYFTPGSRYLRTVEHLIFGETSFGYRLAAVAVAVSGVRPVPAIFRCANRTRDGFDLHRDPDRRVVRLDILHLRQARGARLRRLGRGHPVPCRRDRNCRHLVAGAQRAVSRRRSAPHCCSPSPCSCVRTSPSARRSCWAAPASRRCGSVNISGSPDYVSAFCRCSAWRCTTGITAASLSCSAATPSIAAAMPMPPGAYVSALWELLRLDFAGGDLARGARQIGRMLIGPSESVAMIPVHAAAC